MLSKKLVIIFIVVVLGVSFMLIFKTLPAKNQIHSSRLSPVESSSDLSYIVVTLNKSANAKLLDSQNKEISSSFVQPQIKNPQTNQFAGADIKELEVVQPITGIYYLTVSSSADIDGDILIYDRNGNSKSVKINGKNGEMKYKINFNKDDYNLSTISPQE